MFLKVYTSSLMTEGGFRMGFVVKINEIDVREEGKGMYGRWRKLKIDKETRTGRARS
jgi:hypothetical protein